MSKELRNIDLTPEQLKIISGLLTQYIPDSVVWAYGSRVKWTSTPKSDLDLVAFASSEQKRSISKLREAFEESSLPFRVDLFIWSEVPEQFHKNIRKDRVVLQDEANEHVIGSEWHQAPLTDLYNISSGLSKPAKDFGSGHPFLAFKDVFYNYFLPDVLTQLVQSSDQEQKKGSIRRGDVFLTRTSETMNELGMSSVALKDYDRATFNGFTKRLRPNGRNALVPEFVGYYLRSPKFRNKMLTFSTMSTRASLNNEMIGRLTITFPSVDEQKAIGFVLKTLDDKIELNRRMNTTLEGMAQALFKSWFVDFDPVIDKALAAGHPIPDPLHKRAEIRRALGEKRKPLPAAIKQHFPSHFVFSEEMEWVPEGWEDSTVGTEFDVTMGQSPPGNTYNEHREGIAFFQGRADFGFRYPTNRVYCTAPKRLAVKGDSLVSVRAPVGDVNMAGSDCCIGRGVGALRHKSGSRSFTYYAMLQLRESFNVFEAEGTVFGSINQKDFKALPQSGISFDLVQEFENYAGKIDGKIELNTDTIQSLEKLRDILLPKLLSGQLQVKDAKRIVHGAII